MLSAQMQGYLADDLWIDLAKQANTMGQKLATGLANTRNAEFMHPSHANMVFASWPRAIHDKLAAQGSKYYFWPADPASTGDANEMLSARLVCNWSTTDKLIDQFLDNF
jgi:threonine aldolase